MESAGIHSNLSRMRSYASIFSSTSFSKIIKGDKPTFIDSKIRRFDSDHFYSGKFETYIDYIRYVYKELGNNYRNEYFYKNTFINSLLINQYGVKDTVAVNEFRVGNSIADIVLFNGTSKAFEIKTELDDKTRLGSQIADYTKVFEECYIVTDESLIEKYSDISANLGLIALRKQARSFKMVEVRKAHKNEKIVPETLMRCVRTSEYLNIVKEYYKELPAMNSFNMFDICSELIAEIPQEQLKLLFLKVLKKRKTNTAFLKNMEREMRQVGLALKLNEKKYNHLIAQLNKPINL
nr:sce7726 family protein [uncultured Draconibacterium sp.]